MANEAFRCPSDIVQADTETDLLDDLVGVFRIDVVLNGVHALFVKVLWRYLDQVRNFCLGRPH